MPSTENAFAAELPSLLAWRAGLVGRMAQRIHNAGDWEALPVLADALDEAGCTVSEVLKHLRSGMSHYNHCWVTLEILKAYRLAREEVS